MIDDLKIHEEAFPTCLNVLCDSWLAGIFPSQLKVWLSPVSVAGVWNGWLLSFWSSRRGEENYLKLCATTILLKFQ